MKSKNTFYAECVCTVVIVMCGNSRTCFSTINCYSCSWYIQTSVTRRIDWLQVGAGTSVSKRQISKGLLSPNWGWKSYYYIISGNKGGQKCVPAARLLQTPLRRSSPIPLFYPYLCWLLSLIPSLLSVAITSFRLPNRIRLWEILNDSLSSGKPSVWICRLHQHNEIKKHFDATSPVESMAPEP